MEAIAELLQNTNVTADERFPVDSNDHEKLTLSTKEESGCLMELESDISRTGTAISGSVEGNIQEKNKENCRKNLKRSIKIKRKLVKLMSHVSL